MAKEKLKKPIKTAKQRATRFGKVVLVIVLIIPLAGGPIAILNGTTTKSLRNFVNEGVKQVEYTEQLKPEIGDDGYYTFTTDRDFKIVQLTDVHIGGGIMSSKNDNMALNAVAAMVTAEKPDLVIVTGDIAYPVPFQSLTINNKTGAVTFAQLMEKLGVYWCGVYGNHDTELYSLYSRKDISKKVYGNKEKYPHCLFQTGPDEVDGYGNYVINVKNTKGKITQSLFMIDSHSYTDGDYLGLFWKYDAIHPNQVQWYKDTVKSLTEENGGARPNSLAFFHIPLIEMSDAFNEYRKAGEKDTENVKYKYGIIGEGDFVICTSQHNNGMFDAFKENGTTGMFFGHDHLNNMSLNYKGVQMTYGYSVDYLAYSGINKFGLQRGCTVITVKPDGTFDNVKENYYQDKYKPVNPKEQVDLEHEMKDVSDNAGAVFEFQKNNNNAG